MQYIQTLMLGNMPLFYLLFAVVALVLVVSFFLVYRALFGRRLRLPGGARARQPRLGVVEAQDIDRERQLVLVRRDNVEHLIMIGGPNDVLIESQIVRVEGRATREKEAPLSAPVQPAVQPAVQATPQEAPKAAPQVPAPPVVTAPAPSAGQRQPQPADSAGPGKIEPKLTPPAAPMPDPRRPEPRPPFPAPAAPAMTPPANPSQISRPAPLQAPNPAPPLAATRRPDYSGVKAPEREFVPNLDLIEAALVQPLVPEAPPPYRMQITPPSGLAPPSGPLPAPVRVLPQRYQPPFPPQPASPPTAQQLAKPANTVAQPAPPAAIAAIVRPALAPPRDKAAPALSDPEPSKSESLDALEEEMARLLGRPLGSPQK